MKVLYHVIHLQVIHGSAVVTRTENAVEVTEEAGLELGAFIKLLLCPSVALPLVTW